MLVSLALSLPWLVGQVYAGCVYANQAAGINPRTPDLHKRDIDESLVVRDENRTLIGDLRYNITTPVGRSIANIILGTETGQNQTVGTAPTTTQACKADPCCVWYKIAQNLTARFREDAPPCGDAARALVRAGFHDAATWSAPREAKGNNCCGADGSLLLSGKEINSTDNLGLEMVPGLLMPLYQEYKVGMADLIQFAANHATVTCTQGPRVRTFVGRKDSKQAAPPGLLPEPYQSANTLVKLFADKTIVSDDLISLVGAHTTAKQFFVNKTAAGEPFDLSPAIWDFFYYESLLQPQNDGVFRLQSDYALATSAKTKARWTQFADGSQTLWNNAYAMAYVRLSLLGVNNINNLTECTAALPAANID